MRRSPGLMGIIAQFVHFLAEEKNDAFFDLCRRPKAWAQVIMSLFLCSLLLSNLHIFEISGISHGVSSELYMSADIFFLV